MDLPFSGTPAPLRQILLQLMNQHSFILLHNPESQDTWNQLPNPISSVSETCQALPVCQLLARERANWELCKHFCSFSLVLKPVYVSLSFSSKVNTRYQAVLVIQLFGLYTEIFSHSCRADFLHAKHKKLLFLKFSLFPLYIKKKILGYLPRVLSH